MQYTIDKLRQHLYQKVFDVYDVFKNFFGEKYVDLQGAAVADLRPFLAKHGLKDALGFDASSSFSLDDEDINALVQSSILNTSDIYVWWPKVTVTNENDKSIVIYDLYARITVQSDGRIPYEYTGFLLNRATYTDDQFACDYLHSHIRGIPKSNLSSFCEPCLGHGPIKNTINSLKGEFDETLWMLFCQELSMYVTVESIKGGPWRRLEGVCSRTLLSAYTEYAFDKAGKRIFNKIYPDSCLKDFIKYYLEHGHLSLSFVKGRFVCGLPFYNFIVDISNSFIEFFNLHLAKTEALCKAPFYHRILYRAIASNGRFYSTHALNSDDYSEYKGKVVLTFKGHPVTVSIIEDNPLPNYNQVALLDIHIAMFILKNILRTVNFKFQNEQRNTASDGSSSSARQRVIYL